MIDNPNRPERKPNNNALPPILRKDIEQAQAHTNSNAQAARWLNVSYRRYKRYAVLYGLFDRHLNVTGIGIEKGFAKRPTSIPLRDIIAGKHPDYSLAKLKNRLIARKKIVEECGTCGFNERRITDKKMPLILTFKDGNRKNFSLENLELLCYNCMFLTSGAPTTLHKKGIEKSLLGHETGYRKDKAITSADHYDPTEDDNEMHIDDIDIDNIDLSDIGDIDAWDLLTEEEKRTLYPDPYADPDPESS